MNVPLYSSEQSLPVIDLLCGRVGQNDQDQAHYALAQADGGTEAEAHGPHGCVDVGIDDRYGIHMMALPVQDVIKDLNGLCPDRSIEGLLEIFQGEKTADFARHVRVV